MKKYTEFFNRFEDYSVRTTFYENTEDFTIEELYQVFKARLMNEVEVQTPTHHGMAGNYAGRGKLVDRPKTK